MWQALNLRGQGDSAFTLLIKSFKCKCRFLILFFHMFSYLFLINRTIFVRETSFQQVLLSSSGPKENIVLLKACLSNKNSPVNEKKIRKQRVLSYNVAQC